MRETSNLEFKRELTKTYLKTVSAFANYKTGRIIFGVDDSGQSVGLEDPLGACLSIENESAPFSLTGPMPPPGGFSLPFSPRIARG